MQPLNFVFACLMKKQNTWTDDRIADGVLAIISILASNKIVNEQFADALVWYCIYYKPTISNAR